MEVDLDEEWVVPPAMPHSKCGWTPFVGMRLRGRVRRVVLRGQVAYVDGVVTAAPGAGQNIRYMPLSASQPAHPAQALLSSPVVSSVADHAQLDAVPPPPTPKSAEPVAALWAGLHPSYPFHLSFMSSRPLSAHI